MAPFADPVRGLRADLDSLFHSSRWIDGRARTLAGTMLCALVPQLHAAAAEGGKYELGTLSVVGRGETRATSTIDLESIESLAPGRTPERLLNTLPGVNVQTSDPYGLYEFGTTIRVRGFDEEQLGVTMDGVPMETADLREGSPPHRYVDSENIVRISVSQGSGDVTTPSYHALGGSIRYFSDDPTPMPSAIASLTAGSDELVRNFFRVDSGTIGELGLSFYISGSRARQVQWANDLASLERDHLTVKALLPLGAHSLRFAYRYNKRDDHDFPLWLANGDRFPYFDLHPHVVGDPEADALHYDRWANGREDHLYSLNADLRFSPQLSATLVPYYEDKEGYGWANVSLSAATDLYNGSLDPVAGTPGRTDVAPPTGLTARDETMNGERLGITASLAYQWGTHRFEVGVWGETTDFHQDRPLFNLNSVGDFDKDSLPVHVYYDRDFTTDVVQFFARDQWRLMDDRLTLEYGFKTLDFERRFEGIANSDAFNMQREISGLRQSVDDMFQPQVGLTFLVAEGVEGFFNYAENFSAPPRESMVAQNFNPDLDAERSKNYDLGVRYSGGGVDASFTLYYIDYQNRILELTSFDPFRVGESIFENVGDIETQGAELAVSWSPMSNLKLGSSVTYNSSEFQDNYYSGVTGTGAPRLVEVKGEQVPDTPKFMLQGSVSYYEGPYFVTLDGKHTGKRYSATTGAESVPSYEIFDLTLGYQGRGTGPFANLRYQFNILNLFDEEYMAVINEAETSGLFIPGAPRTYFFTVRADF